MKKLTFNISLFILFLLLSLVVFYLYIQPQEELNLKAEPIDVSEKIKEMVINLKTEVVLSESEIDSIIKMKINPIVKKHFVIEGANFYIEENMLHAKLNVIYRDTIKAELNVLYSFTLHDSGMISLQPVNIKLKDIPLPASLLEPMDIQLYDMKNSIVKVTEIENKARKIIIKWKIDLF